MIAYLLSLTTHLLPALCARSARAAAVAIIVLLAQLCWRRRLTPAWRCGLWSLVLLQLILPTLPESRFSIFNALQFAHRHPSPAPRLSSEAASNDDQLITTSGFLPAESLAPQPSIAAIAPPAPSSIPLVIGLAWFVGVLLLSARLIWTNVAFTRRATGEIITSGPQFDLLERCCRDLHINRIPSLILSNAVSIPALAGVLHPRILLPPSVAAALPPRALRLVLLHELCHLKRHDLLVDWLCTLLNVIHWFNPLLWLAAARFRADRELARDAMVLRLTGSDESRSYGLTLLRLAETIHRPGRRPILAPLLAGRTRLVERIHMIARFDARRPRFSIAGLGLLLVVGCSTLSRPKPASEQSAAQTPSSSVGGVHAAQTALSMTTQVYDIRDLINDIPDFDDAPSMALSASAAATRPAPTTKSALPLSRQQAVQHVIVLIRETIDPDSWSNGSAIKEASQGLLAIRQTAANHQQLEQLLTQLRETRAIQISLESRFVVLNEKARRQFGLDHARAATDSAANPHAVFLSDSQVDDLLKSIQADNSSSLITGPRMTTFNGQRAWAMVATQRAYVAGFKIDREDPTKFEPQVDVASSGIKLDVQATISSDRKFVTLTLRPQITRLDRIDTIPWHDAPPGHPMMIQRPVLSLRELQTTASVPDQQTLIMGGFQDSVIGDDRPAPAAAPATQPTTSPSFIHQLMAPPQEDAELFLLVRPKIINQREK